MDGRHGARSGRSGASSTGSGNHCPGSSAVRADGRGCQQVAAGKPAAAAASRTEAVCTTTARPQAASLYAVAHRPATGPGPSWLAEADPLDGGLGQTSPRRPRSGPRLTPGSSARRSRAAHPCGGRAVEPCCSRFLGGRAARGTPACRSASLWRRPCSPFPEPSHPDVVPVLPMEMQSFGGPQWPRGDGAAEPGGIGAREDVRGVGPAAVLGLQVQTHARTAWPGRRYWPAAASFGPAPISVSDSSPTTSCELSWSRTVGACRRGLVSWFLVDELWSTGWEALVKAMHDSVRVIDGDALQCRLPPWRRL